MPDPAITTNDDVAKCLRESGVPRAMQQQALEVNLRRGANSQGFDLLHVSHRHHPVVEFSAYLGDLDERHNTVRREAKGDVELYRFPQAQNLYSPRTNLRLLDSDGTVINGNCMNLHLDDSHLRRTDTFQVVAWGATDSRCWGQIEVMVDDIPYRMVIPSSLYRYTHGHVSRTGTNAGFNVDQPRPGGQLDHPRSSRSDQREISGTGTLVQSHSEASSDEQTVYRNRRYGLKFSLPATWRGCSAISTEWEGRAFVAAVDGLEVIERGPMIVLRHPNWRTGNRYQDIPIMVFTRGQWDACRQGKFAIGAGGVEYEIAHNSTYVFAISSRFNADETLKGWKEASDAVEHNRIANAPHLYPW